MRRGHDLELQTAASACVILAGFMMLFGGNYQGFLPLNLGYYVIGIGAVSVVAGLLLRRPTIVFILTGVAIGVFIGGLILFGVVS